MEARRLYRAPVLQTPFSRGPPQYRPASIPHPDHARREGGSEQDQSDREQQAFMEGLRVMGGPQRVPSFSLTSRGLERPA